MSEQLRGYSSYEEYLDNHLVGEDLYYLKVPGSTRLHLGRISSRRGWSSCWATAPVSRWLHSILAHGGPLDSSIVECPGRGLIGFWSFIAFLPDKLVVRLQHWDSSNPGVPE